MIYPRRETCHLGSMKYPWLSFVLTVTTLMYAPLSEAQESAATPSPEVNALAEELLVLFEVDKNMSATLEQIVAMQEQMLDASPSLNAEQKAKALEAAKVSMAETFDFLSWDRIKPLFIEIYAENFTADELKGMIAFFQSPVGKTWIEKQPAIQIATMQKMQTLMLEVQPKIQEAVKKLMAAPSPTPAP